MPYYGEDYLWRAQLLEEAIRRAQRAVETTPEYHPDRAGRLSKLGDCLSGRYRENGNPQDLNAAIARFEAAAEAMRDDNTDRPRLLSNLGDHLRHRYQQTGHLQDLDAAIARLEAAVQATPAPEAHPDRLSNLGDCLSRRYERTGHLQDLEAAIARSAAAVEAIPEYDPDRAGVLNTLGIDLRSRYERTGNLRDLEAAIARLEEALEAEPGDHPDRAMRLSNLGNCLSMRYERTGNLEDAEAAIARAEAAVRATTKNPLEYARLLGGLGGHLTSRFHRTGNLQDLEAAILQLEAAVLVMPDDHLDRPTLLDNLGNSLSNRYQRTGNLQDLETAIKRTEAAVGTTPEGHPGRAGRLSNLGIQLRSRYNRTGNLQDLEAAIGRLEESIKATPEDHPDRAGLLNNLGVCFSCRYDRTGSLQYLEAAITQSEASLQATPEDHPDRVGRLSNLGGCLIKRYQQSGNLQDEEGAIRRSEAAVQATPENHPSRGILLNNLGIYLSSRYERTGTLQDLEAVIARLEAAVQVTPEDHPDRAGHLINLGGYLSERHRRTGNLQDLEAALAAYCYSWSIISAPTLRRLQAASRAATMLVFSPLVKDLSRASSFLHNATHLLPLVTSRSLEREDQQHLLEQITGLASIAASVSLELGELPLEALRLLELGRSVTNGQLLDYRSDISDLMETYPTLAKEFDSLRQELDSPFAIPSLESSDLSMNQRLEAQQSTIRRRNKLAQELDNILLEIRQKAGFENFLRAESEAYLLSAAHEGPVVVLNVTELRSDAILVTGANVRSIALPHLSHDDMIRFCETSISDNEVMRELLEWLWKGAVQPVLRELGFYPKRVDPLPRIWWIGVGLLAKAPIHAAAKFRNRRVHLTTIQYCLPSYTSTIRALKYSRSRQTQCQQNSSMLIVTMPTTPGASSLSGVTKEADEITGNLQDFTTVEILERPCAERVLQALPGYSIAHFACHGVSEINPADSHLLLRKTLAEEVDKLRVKDIAALKLPAARLAYLSACSTAESTSEDLIDEVTHIVSSFHIAGFIHVIGTLWPSNDQACQKMAVDFYSALRTTDDVAVSYRTAILGLMEQKPLQPIYWAPFIHFGA